jgi:CRP-like cAMP-binding protein
MLLTQNLLLQRLSPASLSEIEAAVEQIELTQGQHLADPMSRPSHVYFPEAGVVSFVVNLTDRASVEAAMIGKDGVVGATEAVQAIPFRNEATVQVSGRALKMNADRFKQLYSERHDLRSAVQRYSAVFVAQVQQSAACNANHKAQARLCRGLLRLHDLAGREFFVTQEYIADLLAVRRPTISTEAHILQEEGLITYRRGQITILDVDKLRTHACECYEAVKEYEKAVFRA